MSNGKDLPAIRITWNVQTQTVGIDLDPSEFKTWDMVLMVLTAAKSQVEFNLNMARMTALQQQAVQAQQEMNIRNQLQL